MTTFEEQFPSLKDKVWRAYDQGNLSPEAVSQKHVIEYCLDKQRVRESLQALEEEVWFIIDETKDPEAYKKACKIRRAIYHILLQKDDKVHRQI